MGLLRLVACTLIVLGMSSLTWAHTSDGGDPGLVHACVHTVNGNVRIVGPAGTCRVAEGPAHWPAGAGGGGGAILVTQDLLMLASDTLFSIGAGVFSSEGRALMAAPRSGTLANLFVVPNVAPASGSIVTVTVRVNGADTALSVTHTDADGTSAKGNTVDTVSVSQGDLISVKFTETGGVNTGTNYRASFEFQ